MPERAQRIGIVLAVLVGLAVRLPGVWWGESFPPGFRGHHVDEWTHLVNAEVMLDPQTPPRWHPNPYPKGMAAHAALPIMLWRAATGQPLTKPPSMDVKQRYVPPERTIFLIGRLASVVYGTLTILVIWLLTRRLTSRADIALVAAWLAALGGLHVSQSHFFTADTGALFWFLLGMLLVARDLQEPGEHPLALSLAAAAMGAAFGMKLKVVGLPVIALAALWRGPRIPRVVQAAAFLLAGFVAVNFLEYTPVDLMKTVARGITGKDQLDAGDFPRLYGYELLASAGLPVVALGAVGLLLAVVRYARRGAWRPPLPLVLGVVITAAIHGSMLLFKVPLLGRFDPFPRHLVDLFPWLWMLAAGAICLVAAPLRARGRSVAWIAVPVLLWQAALVVDGEKGYLHEPRDAAVRWIAANVPQGGTLYWPAYEADAASFLGLKPAKFFHEGEEPDVVVAEMYRVNHFLSGTGLRNSYPRDFRRVFDGQSPELLAAWQSLFQGRPGYHEVARFDEGYWMPELRLANDALGNRSGNYLTELVIFRR